MPLYPTVRPRAPPHLLLLLLCSSTWVLSAEGSSPPTACSTDSVPMCSAAELSGSLCLCTTCLEGYVLNAARTVCEAQIPVGCGSFVSDPRHVCVENSFSGVGGLCTCVAKFRCLSGGACKDTRCAGRDPSCTAYTAIYEDAQLSCACSQCDANHVLGAGLCYTPRGCDDAASHSAQCPPFSSLNPASGKCACHSTHMCSGEGSSPTTPAGLKRCASKEQLVCGMAVDTASQRCAPGTHLPESGGACACDNGLLCTSGRCIHEVLGCGASLSKAYHICGFGMHNSGGICACPDPIHYSCSGDGRSCVLARCGKGMLPGCELYWDQPVDGVCHCRRCERGMILENSRCHTPQVTPSPVYVVRTKIGIIHDLSGPGRVLGLTMLKAELLSIGDVNRAAKAAISIAHTIGDYQGDAQKAVEIVRDMLQNQGVEAILGCDDVACRDAVLAEAERARVRFFAPAQLDGVPCSEFHYATGLTPYQKIETLVAYGVTQARKFFIVRSADPFYQEWSDAAKESIQQQGGIVISGVDDASASSESDLVSIVKTLFTRLPQGGVILALLAKPMLKTFFQTLRREKPVTGTFKVLSYHLSESDIWDIGVESVVGHVSVASFFQDMPIPRAQGFAARFANPGLNLWGSYTSVQGPQWGNVEFANGLIPTDDADAAYSAVVLAAVVFTQRAADPSMTVEEELKRATPDIFCPHGTAKLSSSQYLTKKISVSECTADGKFRIVATTPLLGDKDFPQSQSDKICFLPNLPGFIQCRRGPDCPDGMYCTSYNRCGIRKKSCGAALGSPLEQCKDYSALPDSQGVCRCSRGFQCTSSGCIVEGSSVQSHFTAALTLFGVRWGDIVVVHSPAPALFEVVNAVRRDMAQRMNFTLESVLPSKFCKVVRNQVALHACFHSPDFEPALDLPESNGTLFQYSSRVQENMDMLTENLYVAFELHIPSLLHLPPRERTAKVQAMRFSSVFPKQTRIGGTQLDVVQTSIFVRSTRHPVPFARDIDVSDTTAGVELVQDTTSK